MFIAMAKPTTASVALKLIEEKGLEVGDEIMFTSLLTGQSIEYHFADEKMDWNGHEDAAIAWGGHLTSITSQEEQEHIKELSMWASGAGSSRIVTTAPGRGLMAHCGTSPSGARASPATRRTGRIGCTYCHTMGPSRSGTTSIRSTHR